MKTGSQIQNRVSEYSKKDILRFFPSIKEEKIFVTPLAANLNYKPLSSF